MGLSGDNVRGLVLALASSVFIGASFIIKKKGLTMAGATGTRAGSGGYSYLKEPMWWIGMVTMIGGEVANFAAYAYAPAVLVTPLGALSIIFSELLAHFILKEKLHIIGVVGIVLCVVGSTSIVIHAPHERPINSVKELWHLALEPGFISYTCVVVVLILILVFFLAPRYGQKTLLIYIAICSLAGSLTVMFVKAVGIALKLSFEGKNQFKFFQTWLFILFLIMTILLQLNYLNRALDSFNTNLVSPVYYVAFTCFTILASMIMLKEDLQVDLHILEIPIRQYGHSYPFHVHSFEKNTSLRDWDHQTASQIISTITGFITILCGTFLLHRCKDMAKTPVLGNPIFKTPDVNENPRTPITPITPREAAI